MKSLPTLPIAVLLVLGGLSWLGAGCGKKSSSSPPSSGADSSAPHAGPAPAAAGTASAPVPNDLASQMARGKAVYDRTCIACHQPDGLGIPKAFPPLAESDYLVANLDKVIHGVIYGQQGEMIVKGETYNLVMPPQMLNDQDTADVVTYVLNSFGNPGGQIDIERVKRLRAMAP